MVEQQSFIEQAGIVHHQTTPLHSPCDPTASFDCLVSSSRHQRWEQFTDLIDVLPPNSICESDLWDRNDSVLRRHWPSGAGYFSGREAYRDRHLTYGEVTAKGIRQLAYYMNISRPCFNDLDGGKDLSDSPAEERESDAAKDVVFYDLGSGVGRLVFQMYIDQPERIAAAIGIELSKERHEIGERALASFLEEQYPRRAKDGSRQDREVTAQFPVQLIHGDATELQLLDSTTHVYISSTCLPESVLLKLQEKLLRLPNIRVVAALNRLDLFANGERNREWEERDVPTQMSWGGVSAKIYHRKI